MVCGKKFVGGVKRQLSVISYQLSVISYQFTEKTPHTPHPNS
ncbi:hypothetical protein [Microcystis sp. BLCC-F209]